MITDWDNHWDNIQSTYYTKRFIKFDLKFDLQSHQPKENAPTLFIKVEKNL